VSLPERRGGRGLAMVSVVASLGVCTAAVAAATRAGPSGSSSRGRGGSSASSEVTQVGQVRFVTAGAVYIDRGTAQGLAPRQVLFLTRPGRVKRTRCVVEMVTDHSAICRPAGAGISLGTRVGDVFRFVAPRPRGLASVKATLPRVLPEATLQRRAKLIGAAPHERVDFAVKPLASRAASVTLGASVTVWSVPAGTDVGPRATEQLDVQVHNIRVGQTDLRLDAAATAVHWQKRATQLRFQPVSPAQIFLWDAEISRRELDDVAVFSLGRIWPWHLPGIALLDGIQVGRRNPGSGAEIGAYGGLIPTPLGLSPTTTLWVTGAYGTLSQPGGSGGFFPFLREEARVGLRHALVVGLVTEGEALADATWENWGADAGARVRYAAATEREPVWEQAHVGMRLRSIPRVGGWVQFRYTGVAPEQQPLLINELPALHGGYHASLNGFLIPRDGLQLGGFASYHLDRDSGLRETEGGLDLGVPRLLGDVGGFWFGASVGEGWLRGRTAYIQFSSRQVRAIQVLARLNGSTSEYAASPTPSAATLNLLEVGGLLQIEASLSARFRLRGRALVRAPLVVQGMAPVGQSSALVSGLDAVWLL